MDRRAVDGGNNGLNARAHGRNHVLDALASKGISLDPCVGLNNRAVGRIRGASADVNGRGIAKATHSNLVRDIGRRNWAGVVCRDLTGHIGACAGDQIDGVCA